MTRDANDERARLGRLMEARRRELGLSAAGAAKIARINRATWSSTVTGTRVLREYNYAGIERALEWEPGSIDQILAGAEPTSTSRRPGPQELIPDLDLDYEIERISRLDISARRKLMLLRKLIDLYEQAQAEADRNTTTDCDKEAG